MSMRTKFKLGERVIFTDENGFENFAVITGIAISHDSKGMSVVYRFRDGSFDEAQIVGRVMIQRPRKSRGQKKVDELKRMSSLRDSAMAQFLVNESAA